MLRGLSRLAALLVAVPSCTWVLDFSEPASDAAPLGADVAPLPDAAADTCDAGEPNGAPASATPLAEGVLDASRCPADDVDWYAFTLDGSTNLVALLTFEAAADLDLDLTDPSGTPYTVSNGATGEERIERGMPTGDTLLAGDYLLKVHPGADGSADATVRYRLELTLTD